MQDYRGYDIKRTAYQGSARWYVQTHHQGGTPYAEDACPQFPTLACAKEWIRERVS
jgi:hypothetical protein